MKRLLKMGALALAIAGFMGIAACAEEKTDSTPEADNEITKELEALESMGKLSIDKLTITAIPDSDSKELKKEYKLVGQYLEKVLGTTVEYKEVRNYGGAVTSLVAKDCNIAWLGGKTAVDAENIFKEKGRPTYFIACRDIDYKFKSYFIANKAVVAKYKLKEMGTLEQLKANAKEMSFTLGSTGSTSGHLMPRWFLNEAGMAPEGTFKSTAYSGSHSTTLKQVAAGTVDVGALNYTDWDKASDEVKANAPIVYVAEPYTDYCWVGNDSLTADDAALLTKAFAAIDGDKAFEKRILKAFGNAEMFQKPDPTRWDDIRKILKDPKVVEALSKKK